MTNPNHQLIEVSLQRQVQRQCQLWSTGVLTPSLGLKASCWWPKSAAKPSGTLPRLRPQRERGLIDMNGPQMVTNGFWELFHKLKFFNSIKNINIICTLTCRNGFIKQNLQYMGE